MNRLPERFEKEVLEPVDVIWNEEHAFYVDKYEYPYIDISSYEIAARGLEALIKKEYDGVWKPEIGFSTSPHVISFAITDLDLCECVFEAIREVYK